MSKRLEPCKKCKGCGRLSSKDGKAWVEITTPLPNPDVRSGDIYPVVCEACEGSGQVEGEGKAPAPATVLEPVADGQGTSTSAAVQNVTVTKK
jgi:hypothetical protein